jgi:aryl-alcohol dehydrogenase-like predicted oxidoreductase
MHKVFGTTDLQTSHIVYGCMGGAGAFGPQDERDSIEALRAAFDIGINFFDTAELYGDGYSEQLLSRALGMHRNEIVISSKVARTHLSAADLKSACARSLKNLGTDYIDLYLLHWPNREIPIDESINALKELQQAGKIRYFGVSNFGKKDLTELLDHTDISTNQVGYNLLFRTIEHEVLPICQRKGIPIMCYSSLMQGLLAGKYRSIQDFPENRARTRMYDSRKWSYCRHEETGVEEIGETALKQIWQIVDETGISMEELAVGWLKAQQNVGGVIVGTRNAEQSRNLGRLIEIDLDPSVVTDLTEATDALKEALGPNIDMWGHRTQ